MSRALTFTKPIVRDYQALPDAIKAEVDKALELLVEDPRHPSTARYAEIGRSMSESKESP